MGYNMVFTQSENQNLRKRLLAVTISSIIATSSFAVSADENNEDASAEKDVETISVTGSRLTRTTFDAPTPTVVVSAEEIRISGAVNINDLLTTMPQFGEGLDSTSGNYSFGNSGLNAVNLRGIGETRTLVLLNGKRPVQIADDAQFLYSDIGMIPSELVERIEILTGGASAVYGSDAVAGVVNFILKKDYQGTAMRAQVSGTNDGGHSSRSFTITHGLNFDEDRGNLSFSIDYLNESALRQSDRKGSVGQQRSVANPRNTGPDDGIPDRIWLRDLTTTEWGGEATIFGIWNYDHSTPDWYQVDENGNHTLRTAASNVADGWLATDGSGFPLDRWGHIEDPFERVNAFAQLNYQFDTFDLAFDVTYSKAESGNIIDPPFKNVWMYIDDMEAAFDVPSAIASEIRNGDGWAQMHYTFYEAKGRYHENDREYLAANLSLSGDMFEDWRWDVNFTSGKTEAELFSGNALRNDRINDSLQIIGPCVADNTCPSFNPFARPSQEVLDYILDEHTTTTEVVNHAFSANIAGDLYELPAGMVQMSTGLEVRYESLDYAPSELWQSGNLSSQMTAMDASRNIKEVYAEVLVPVLADVAGAKALDIEMAVRKAEYSTEASSFTSSKLGVNWSINDDVRFRSTFSKAVRAPQLTELFAGESIGYTDMSDPCHKDNIYGGPDDGRRVANCALLGISTDWVSNVSTQRGKAISAGNPELREEKAETITAGVVFQPSFIKDFRLSLDYYDIKLEDMISGFGSNAMLSNCVDLAPNSIDNDFCRQVSRAPDGDVLHVRPSSLNADQGRRRGLDIEADYSIGNFSMKLVAVRQLESSLTEYDVVAGESITDDDLGQLSIPKWQANLTTTYTEGNFSASWTYKFKQGGRLDQDASEEYRDTDNPGNSNVHNIRASYNLTDEANVYVGVNNVTNHSGLDHWTTSYGTRNGWSILGRSYYAGVIYNF